MSTLSLSLSALRNMGHQDRYAEIGASLPRDAAAAMFNVITRYPWRTSTAVDVRDYAWGEAARIRARNPDELHKALADGFCVLADRVED